MNTQRQHEADSLRATHTEKVWDDLRDDIAATFAKQAYNQPLVRADGIIARNRAAIEAAIRRDSELDVVGLAVAMNTADITAEEIRLGRDLRVPAGRIAKAYDDREARSRPDFLEPLP